MTAKTLISILAVVAIVAVSGIAYYLTRPVAEEASIDNALTALDDTEAAEPTGADEPTDAEEETAADEAAGGDEPTSTDPEASPSTPGATEPSAGNTTATNTAGPDTAATDTADGPIGDVTGTWTVDTAIGEFDFADATSTFVGFRVAEELRTVGQTEAVGRTPSVTGDLAIDGTVVTDASIEADLSQIVSDVPRRDDAMRRAMGVATNPLATFVLTAPVDIGEVPPDGHAVTTVATGDLTVNGVTKPIEVELEAQVAEGNILVVGRAPVVFADFDITAPQAGPVVSIEDNGTIELQLWFSQA